MRRTIVRLAIIVALIASHCASAATRAQIYADQGDKFFKANDCANAIVAYKKAVALDPKLGLAYYGLGLCYHQQGKWQAAVTAWHHAKALLQSEGAMYITLGNDLYHLKRYDEALQSFQDVINIHPPDLDLAVANYWIGAIYDEEKQADKAIAPLQEAVRLRPDDPDYYFELGKAFVLSRKYPQAVDALKESIRLRPDDPVALYGLGVSYLLVHNIDEAAKIEQTLRPLDEHGADDLHEKIVAQSDLDSKGLGGEKPQQ